MRIRFNTRAVNPPLSLDPSLLPGIEKLVYVSKEHKKEYTKLWQEIRAQKAKKKGRP